MASKGTAHLTLRKSCHQCKLHYGHKRPQKPIVPSTATSQARPYSKSLPRYSKSSTSHPYYPTPSTSTKPLFTHLSNRSLIRLQGIDVGSFLNGLLPSKLRHNPTDTSRPIFTAFLSAKGRLLFDVFLYPPSTAGDETPWYIDVDSRSATGLFSHLKKHKLRSKFKLEKVSQEELGVYYTWPGSTNSVTPMPEIGGQDPRPLMGVRFLSPRTTPNSMLSALAESGQSATWQDYEIHRMLCGHAEGPTELISQHGLPQESNLDFYDGIDFHKGCYLGQELTIRTHHTGVVRKRILPCQIYPSDQAGLDQQQRQQTIPIFDSSLSVPLPADETSISKVRSTGRAGRSTGKWLGGVGNIGLALCRLEMMTNLQLTAEGTSHDPNDQFALVWEEADAEADPSGTTTIREVKLKPFVPQWLRHSIQDSIKARSERGKKRRQEEEDEDDEVA